MNSQKSPADEDPSPSSSRRDQRSVLARAKGLHRVFLIATDHSLTQCRAHVVTTDCVKNLILKLFLFTSAALSVGCATYQTNVEEARLAFRDADPARAVQLLEARASSEGDDQLVYLLDYATALQQAKRFKESTEAFQKAEKIADIQDYTSLSRVASSLALSESMIQYKGEDYEKVLINALNAINYLEMGGLDDALVEVRRLNQKLYKFKYEAKRDYEQNPFAYYLGAVIWEADRKWDDAYIAYKNAFDLVPSYQPLGDDLIRSAMRSGRTDELEKWRKKFPDVKTRPEWTDSSMGEIVFIYQQGWGPRKYPHPENVRFPKLFAVSSTTQNARLLIDGAPSATTQKIFSVQDVAIKTLEADYARLVASRLAGVATKAVLADQLRQRNEALGDLAWIAMNVADQADLRQWSTLPQTFRIARVFVKAGRYKIGASGLDASGAETDEHMPEREIEVRAGQKTFLTWRSVK